MTDGSLGNYVLGCPWSAKSRRSLATSLARPSTAPLIPTSISLRIMTLDRALCGAIPAYPGGNGRRADLNEALTRMVNEQSVDVLQSKRVFRPAVFGEAEVSHGAAH